MGENQFKNIHNHPHMGLNNTICEQRDYFCRLHQIYLSSDDVKRKKCNERPTFDLIGIQKCPNLVPVK